MPSTKRWCCLWMEARAAWREPLAGTVVMAGISGSLEASWTTGTSAAQMGGACKGRNEYRLLQRIHSQALRGAPGQRGRYRNCHRPTSKEVER